MAKTFTLATWILWIHGKILDARIYCPRDTPFPVRTQERPDRESSSGAVLYCVICHMPALFNAQSLAQNRRFVQMIHRLKRQGDSMWLHTTAWCTAGAPALAFGSGGSAVNTFPRIQSMCHDRMMLVLAFFWNVFFSAVCYSLSIRCCAVCPIARWS